MSEDSKKTTSKKSDSALPEPPVKFEQVEQPNGETVLQQAAKPDAGFLRDSTGAKREDYSLSVGAGQVQQQVDESSASGVFPSDGSPPAGDHTVAAVTGNTALQELADKGGTAPEDAAGYENTP